MTTSNVAATQSGTQQQQQQQRRYVRVVGSSGVGKRCLVTALGALPRKENDGAAGAATYDWRPAPTLAPVTIVVYDNAEHFSPFSEGSNSIDSDVLVLCFDLTDSESFRAVSDVWCKLFQRSLCRSVLVGTKCDAVERRRVTAAQALELALVECDEFVEVDSTVPPFEGVVYLRQLLAAWLAQDSISPVAASPLQSPLQSPSKQQGCVRSSVWLYDPAEEIDAEGRNADVKLRPISRALFEMREAGGDRSKSLDRRREQTVGKLVTRSRYYGPTESSRSMRWQAHQQQQKQNTTRGVERRRQSTSDVDVLDIEHTKLENKSYMQTTKLAQQRVDEMKQRAAADVVSKVKSSKSDKPKDRSRSRSRAMSTMPTGALADHRARLRTASLSPSKYPSHSPTILSRPMFSLLDDDAAGEYALNLLSPGAEKVGALPAPPLLAHIASPVPPVSSPRVEMFGYTSSDESSDDDVQAITPLPPSPARAVSPPATENPVSQTLKHEAEDEVGKVANEEEGGTLSNDIDDMLDYFDGITLPI